MSVRAIVLAAGRGTRMKSPLPKVVHEAAGRPLVAWVLDAVAGLEPAETVVVVGHGADLVRRVLPPGVTVAEQREQLGTGHAVMAALEQMGPVSGDSLVVVPGDSPLFRAATLAALVEAHRGADAALLTARTTDPSGYGRVLRDGDRVVGIVEEKDASPQQREIDEIAVSTYAFEGGALTEALGRIGRDNHQGEYYLTDVIGILAAEGTVRAVAAADAEEVLGVNSHDQLAAAAGVLRRRINLGWMQAGVWMQDPARTYVDATVRLAPGARILADTHLLGSTTVETGAEVGPGVYAVDTRVGAGARLWYSVSRGADVGPGAQVGPYASLREGTVLREGSKAGTFVETKKTTVGRGSKIPHLSYMGDATIGEGTNIGAGTITCNYDGHHKHPTVIGDRVFVGSDTMLVAPVSIGDDAVTGAGSTITRDVEPGALAVERSTQKQVPGYAARRARRSRHEDGE
jgi:bifunctional UDP-N-acetylglucosamine pyrophosphorylase/glucosamine-1-phosphate N-acetyltransferase